MVDILVLGATGFTGCLVTEYLSKHPERSSFTLGIAARSKPKLATVRKTLGLDASVQEFQVDVTKPDELEEVVQQTRVVINTVGPYWRWGTAVVKACVRHGKHYVDLAGETPWIRDIIFEFDYFATKTHSIIIPSCGFDSVPSDIAAFLANKTMKALAGPETNLGPSVTAVKARGGISGGSIQSLIASLEEVPRWKRNAARADYCLSTVQGVPSPKPKLFYTLPFSNPLVYGGIFIMAASNRAIVQRTWGLHEWEKKQTYAPLSSERRSLSYGPRFTYDEFMVMPSKLSSIMLSVGLALGMMSLLIPPFRWLLKKFAPQPGEGPSEKTRKNGFFEYTNVTSSVPTPSKPKTHVRTIIKGHGDPGYDLTAVMISESALSILLSHSELPPLAQEGGVLTPMSALGDVLVRRLESTGRFEFHSEVVLGVEDESRKTR